MLVQFFYDRFSDDHLYVVSIVSRATVLDELPGKRRQISAVRPAGASFRNACLQLWPAAGRSDKVAPPKR